MTQEVTRWAAYGILAVTVFIVSMIFTDTCMDMIKKQREKTMHSKGRTCYTNSKKPDVQTGVKNEEG